MISFRLYAADTDSVASGTQQVAIENPTSGTLLVDGDLLLAAILIPHQFAVSITPPAGWTELRTVRSAVGVTAALQLAVFWKFAESEPARWVWSIDGHPNALYLGSIVAYRGVDYFAPFDVHDGNTNAGAATIAAPPLRTADEREHLVLFYAGNLDDVWVPPSGVVRRGVRRRSGGTILSADVDVPSPQTTAAFEAQMSAGAGTTASLAVALRFDATTVTADDARRSLQSYFPPGSDGLWDWSDPSTNIYKANLATGEFFKRFGFDLRDLLERESRPTSPVLKIPDWEAALGISQAVATRLRQSSVAARRDAIVAKLRESGSATKANIRAALEPLLGYDRSGNGGTLIILETDRYKLREAHTREDGTSVTIGALANTTKTLNVADDGYVSAAGAQVDIQISADDATELSFTLTGPAAGAHTVQAGTVSLVNGNDLVTGSGTRFTAALEPSMQISADAGATYHTVKSIQNDTLLTLTANSAQTLTNQAYQSRTGQASASWAAGTLPAGIPDRSWFRLSNVAGVERRTIFGNWTFRMDTGASGGASLHHVRLFVEGASRDAVGNDGLGTAVFYWCAVIEESKVLDPDYEELLRAIDRLAPAHGIGFYVRVNPNVREAGYGAIPSAVASSPYAIPGRCIPSFGTWTPWRSVDGAEAAVLARVVREGRTTLHPAHEGYYAWGRLP